MTILSRYIFRQALGAVVLILASLTGVIWIAVALRQLETITSQGQSSFVFVKMTTLALPGLLAFVAPVALLIATVHVLNRLNGDSELIIATAGGASTWRLLWPLTAVCLIVTLGVGLVNHLVAPTANRYLRTLLMQARTDLISQVLQPGVFTAPEPKLTVHIRDKAQDGRLLGLLIHDARNPAQVSSYLAESGYIVKQGPAAYLLMSNGHILRSQPNAASDVIMFERYAVDINRFEQKTDSSFQLRPTERTTDELINPDPNDAVWKENPGRYRSELHDRLSNTLYPLMFIFLALACVGQAQTTRQNRTNGVIAAVGIGFGCRMLGISFTNQAIAKAGAVPYMYAVPLAVMLLAIISISYNMRPRPPSGLARLLQSLPQAFAKPEKKLSAAARP
jgi:lipopolysaccharide export system permease protein